MISLVMPRSNPVQDKIRTVAVSQGPFVLFYECNPFGGEDFIDPFEILSNFRRSFAGPGANVAIGVLRIID
jgi:hypothetical protein